LSAGIPREDSAGSRNHSATAVIHRAMTKTKLILAAAIVVAPIGWYLFRPELIFVNRTVTEAAPQAAAPADTVTTVAKGVFHSNAHETRGTATIHRFTDGRVVLRLSDFMTSNGPDVRVYLVAASDVVDNKTPKEAGFVDLGSLKGNIGDQNYEISASVDLSRYRAVSIWCKRFSVNFGAAPLM
jgi:hypothetical protein